MPGFSTLRWRNNALDLIDQPLLPDRGEYVHCTSARPDREKIEALLRQ